MHRFDLNLLSALNALLNERNVTRAADRLHVTQPTMSGMLQRLRLQFDDQLLVRNGRTLELTPLGASLVNPVREALSGVDALARVEPVFDAATSRRTFSLMMSDYCTKVLMPFVIGRIATIAPDVRVEIHGLYSPVERIVTGEIDLCVTIDGLSLLLGARPDVILESAPLFSDEFVCIVAQDHPLDEYATLTDHLRYPHIGVKISGNVDQIDVGLIRQHDASFKPAYLVEEFSLVPGIVASSRLVGVVQRRLAAIAARTYDIRAFPPPYARPAINEAMYWHPRCSDDPSQIWLRRMLVEAASTLTAQVSDPPPLFGSPASRMQVA